MVKTPVEAQRLRPESKTFFSLRTITHRYNKENLAKLKKMDSLVPPVMKDFWAGDKAAVAEGAIPIKYNQPNPG